MSRTFYLNDQFIPEEQAVIPVTSHALHYGTGCFEGIRAYYNESEHCLYIFRMKDHYHRMLASAKLLFIDMKHTEQQLGEVTQELLKKNFSETDTYIRPLAFKSDPAVGNFNLEKLADSFLIYTVQMGRYLDTSAGIKAMTSSWRRVSDAAIPPRGKITGAYVNTALAKTEALQNGFDEALLLDDRGHVAEGSAENVFIVRNGIVITPPPSDDILVGITRDTVMTLLRDELHLTIIESSIDRSEIYGSDELFFVGTGAEITPVIEVDRRSIGDGQIGAITKQLQELYFKLVHGQLDVYKQWLTRVDK